MSSSSLSSLSSRPLPRPKHGLKPALRYGSSKPNYSRQRVRRSNAVGPSVIYRVPLRRASM
eukprot:3431051-Prymnesium_polylepis.1